MSKETFNVGMIWMGDDDHTTTIKQDENGNFLNPQDELEDWAHCLNNPWSDTSMHYSIHPNYQDPTKWIAQKTVIVYDSIEGVIAASGDTPQDAITNCEEFIKKVTEKYYKEDPEED